MFGSVPTLAGRSVGLLQSKINSPFFASFTAQDANPGMPLVELNLANYNADGASISCSGQGTKFSCTIWPVSEATASVLQSAVQQRGTIHLFCYGEPLILELTSLERKEPDRVRFTGGIVMQTREGGPKAAPSWLAINSGGKE